MSDFKLPTVPKSTYKTIWFPNEIINQVEKEIEGTENTFSSFVVAAVRAALENLEEQRQREKPNE